MSAELGSALVAQLQSFLESHPAAVMLEGGEVVVRFNEAEYSLRPERDRRLLQVWSEDRNVVRGVIAAEPRNDHLRLTVQRFGQSKPTTIELVPQEEQRPQSAKRISRVTFQRILRRSLERAFPGWHVESLSSAADLEHSFGPVHLRGLASTSTGDGA